ncbi:hypothetical protein CYMTET_45104 [Cymbomonas tetramitiformis]|uniref:Uncharacterized protein n=1 Tax=Cymbomonas tetramitiformis TaxID=36881 RepID=A0AAE0C0L1_9CHLO|nr:hypothetical protein CYMTET_45109 [Cymbomonas tetramitiformis]KAK3245315.1 hypothetical protein CYMTET_45104 [Cymbomonas tetramitiformis]
MYLALNVPEEEVARPETLVAHFCQMMVAQERELAGASTPRNGVKVNKYLYQDISEHRKRVAKARCAEMVRKYPTRLRAGALSLEALPDDMKLTTRDMLIQQGALTA